MAKEINMYISLHPMKREGYPLTDKKEGHGKLESLVCSGDVSMK